MGQCKWNHPQKMNAWVGMMQCVSCEARVNPGPVACPKCAGPLEITFDDLTRWFAFSAKRHSIAAARWSVGLAAMATVMVLGSQLDGTTDADAGDIVLARHVVSPDRTEVDAPVKLSVATISEEQVGEAESLAVPTAEPAVMTSSDMAIVQPAMEEVQPDLSAPMALQCAFKCETRSDYPIGYSIRRSYSAAANAAELIAEDAQTICEETGGVLQVDGGPVCAPAA